MNAEFIEALRQIEREKDIPFDTLWQALEVAMSTAYKKTLGVDQEVSLRLENVPNKSPIYFRRRTVVESVTNPHGEITLEAASPPRPPSRSWCSASAKPSATRSLMSSTSARAS
jgi:transcription termination/antitermination protein NusA